MTFRVCRFLKFAFRSLFILSLSSLPQVVFGNVVPPEIVLAQQQAYNTCLARLNAVSINKSALFDICHSNVCKKFSFPVCTQQRVILPTIEVGNTGNSESGRVLGNEVNSAPRSKTLDGVADHGGKVSSKDGSTPPVEGSEHHSSRAHTSQDKHSSGGTDSVAASSSQAQETVQFSTRDVLTCQLLAQEAETCCANPSLCGASDMSRDDEWEASMAEAQESLVDACSQMRKKGGRASRGNTQGADICLARYTTCVSSCSNLANSPQVSAEAADLLNEESRRCSLLASRVTQLLNQSNNFLNASKGSLNCEKAGQSAGHRGLRPQNANVQPSSDCQKQPNAPGCGGAQVTLTEGKTASESQKGAAVGSVKRETASQFDLPDNSDVYQPERKFADDSAPEPVPVRVQSVPNNTGGSLPGADWSTKSNGTAPPRQPRDSGYDLKNLDQGFRSGGYSQTTNEFAVKSSLPTPKRAGNLAPYRVGMDLKQYLPGGQLDPHARLRGNRFGKQIHGPVVNIWKRISDRMQEKCRLGQLNDCAK